jgi:hypothetical protein
MDEESEVDTSWFWEIYRIDTPAFDKMEGKLTKAINNATHKGTCFIKFLKNNYIYT